MYSPESINNPGRLFPKQKDQEGTGTMTKCREFWNVEKLGALGDPLAPGFLQNPSPTRYGEVGRGSEAKFGN